MVEAAGAFEVVEGVEWVKWVKGFEVVGAFEALKAGGLLRP